MCSMFRRSRSLKVQVFGYIELFGGSLKLLIVAMLALIMFFIDWGGTCGCSWAISWSNHD